MFLTPDELHESALSLCRIRGWDPEEQVEERTSHTVSPTFPSVVVPYGNPIIPPNPGGGAFRTSVTIIYRTRLDVAKREIRAYCEIGEAVKTALGGDF